MYLNALAVASTAVVDVATSLVRANERDGLDVFIVAEEVDS